jgi:hypothetical protein
MQVVHVGSLDPAPAETRDDVVRILGPIVR